MCYETATVPFSASAMYPAGVTTSLSEPVMPSGATYRKIPDGSDKLDVVNDLDRTRRVNSIVSSLRNDHVALINGLNPNQADDLILDVAKVLDLEEELELQAGFADFLGHRSNVGKYFMTVNRREECQFVPPHSEGDSFAEMQLASFFGYENSTDGGETILMNVDSTSDVWGSLREETNRAILGGRPMSQNDIRRARALYQIQLPKDTLKEDDEILSEYQSEIPGLTIARVRAKPRKTYSTILRRELHGYWDSIASIDHDNATEFAELLKQCELLKQPANALDIAELDSQSERRSMRSGAVFTKLFTRKIMYKLKPGDLVIFNNVSWTHATNNWSPGSGVRRVAAAFA